MNDAVQVLARLEFDTQTELVWLHASIATLTPLVIASEAFVLGGLKKKVSSFHSFTQLTLFPPSRIKELEHETPLRLMSRSRFVHLSSFFSKENALLDIVAFYVYLILYTI